MLSFLSCNETRSDVNFDLLHFMDSFKDHDGDGCFVNVVNPSTKPWLMRKPPHDELALA